MRLAVAFAVIVGSHSVAHAGSAGAILVPPAEVDFGMGPTLGGNAIVGASDEILAGMHWASLAWKPTPIDIGFGYVGVRRDVMPGYAAREVTPVNPDQDKLMLDGVYFDLAYTLENQRHWRTWLAGRTEWLSARANNQAFTTHGFALRIATELFARTTVGMRDPGFVGMIAGTFAIGFYVEASHRDLPAELGPDAVTAGLSLRLPFMLAAGR